MKCRATAAVVALLTVATAAATGSPQEVLFPQPFQVEHSVVQVEPDGARFETEPVIDTYGGGWIVSQRPDGSRLILDLVRREMTELWPASGSYTVLSFDRFATLTRRMVIAEGGLPAVDEAAAADGWRVIAEETSPATVVAATKSSGAGGRPYEAAGTRHLEVRAVAADQGTGRPAPPPVDVWVAPEVLLGAPALDALEALEGALSWQPPGPPTAGAMIAAARRSADGAFVVRTVRSIRVGDHPDDVASVEDVAHRLEPLTTLPAELLVVPDTFTRVAHPLEVMVEHAESEAELRHRVGQR